MSCASYCQITRYPADRFLAATAIAFSLIPVTADEKLIGIPGLKVLANV